MQDGWGRTFKFQRQVEGKFQIAPTKSALTNSEKMGIIKTEGRNRKRWSPKKLLVKVTAYLAMSGYFLFVSCSTNVATLNNTKV